MGLSVFRPGDWVEVCSFAEVQKTLDSQGCLEGIPFMPEMRRFCGGRYQVQALAYKTCIEYKDMRSLENCVFLHGLRCDGHAHYSCSRGCLIFWKVQWLTPVDGPSSSPQAPESLAPSVSEPSLFCQSTALEGASQHLALWNVGHLFRDYLFNRIPPSHILKSVWITLYSIVSFSFGKREWGAVYGIEPRVKGEILDLKPGDRVRVKSFERIQQTLDRDGRHKGLSFTPDMKKFCGREFTVRSRVDNIILEHTKEVRRLKNTVTLEGAVCDGSCRLSCSRAALTFFREQWLERA